MKERPIILSTDMVKAILDGRKTMTRRVIKPQPPINHYIASFNGYFLERATNFVGLEQYRKCPYGQVGDRLWVRETWAAQSHYDDYPPRVIPSDSVIFYRVNDRLKLEIAKEHRDLGKWRSSIFMPQWASRITLEITKVRVERLQEINDRDCFSEGIFPMPTIHPRIIFSQLWDSLNAKRGYSWESNLWIWVMNFRKI